MGYTRPSRVVVWDQDKGNAPACIPDGHIVYDQSSLLYLPGYGLPPVKGQASTLIPHPTDSYFRQNLQGALAGRLSVAASSHWGRQDFRRPHPVGNFPEKPGNRILGGLGWSLGRIPEEA